MDLRTPTPRAADEAAIGDPDGPLRDQAGGQPGIPVRRQLRAHEGLRAQHVVLARPWHLERLTMSQRNLRYLQATILLATSFISPDVPSAIGASIVAGCLALLGVLSPPWDKA